MNGDLPAEVAVQVQSLAAEGRAQLESALFGRPSGANRLRLALLRGLGAVALGIFAAGLSILSVVVLLNLVMHYSPS